MHVVIAGCGRVGSELATSLERLSHTVAVIDKNPKVFDHPRTPFKGDRIVGFAFDQDILEQAGIERAGAFAAVTNGDNSNIVSARIAREHYRVPQVVARIYDPRRAQIYQRLGIQTVATVRWTTDQILRSLMPEDVPVEYTVDNGEVVITAIPAPPEVVGRSLVDLDTTGRHRVVALSRFGVPRLPDPETSVQEGDILHIAVMRQGAASLSSDLKNAGAPE